MNATQSVFRIDNMRWFVTQHSAKGKPPLAMLHGFAGSSRTWDLVVPMLSEHFRITLIDLPGHGRTDTPRENMTFAQLAGLLRSVLFKQQREPMILAGYSMGGRVALHFALTFPHFVRGLILIGASPGISDTSERASRRKSDDELAAKIRTNGVEWFTSHWERQPIFNSQHSLNPALQEFIRSERLSSRKDGLAYALECFGTGVQENLRPRLHELRCPVLLLAGELDFKFCESNTRMRHEMHNAGVECVEIAEVGHAAHIEDPLSVASAITEFFRSTSKI